MEKDEEKSYDITCYHGSGIGVEEGRSMNNEINMLLEQLLDAVRQSKEYNQYQNLLASLKKQPELYQRIGEFRRRSVSLQLAENVNMIEENNALQKEFADLQVNGLASEFMAAEHQYCQLIRELQSHLLEEIDLEIDFLEG